MAYCYDDYIAHAEEAESMAEKTRDEDMKAAWLKIASGYRELALMAEMTRRRADG